MNHEQFQRLRIWAGEAVSNLNAISFLEDYHGDKSRLRHIAEQLQDIVKELDDLFCMCGHKGPDRQGEHIGAEIPAPSHRLACTHPGCNCKGFGTLRAAVDFIMDERLGGP